MDEHGGDGVESRSGAEVVDGLPRLELLRGPSPLYRLDGLSGRLGLPVWIKRDDLNGVALGGNKIRKLEFLLADARAKGARAVVAGGGTQSNFASATAILARRAGLECHLALAASVPIGSAMYDDGGNVAVDRLAGAHIRRYPSGLDSNECIVDLADRVEADSGERPYVIPTGGSNGCGALGFVRAGLEVAAQIQQLSSPVDTIVVASGSGGTQAGLVVGLALAGLPIRVIGVSVARGASSLAEIVRPLAEEVAARLGADGLGGAGSVDWARAVEIDDRCVGDGYGLPSPATWEAIETLIQTDAVVCDPVYTGKALQGLLQRHGDDADSLGRGCLFWHTGGVAGLLAYGDPIRQRYGDGA